MNSFYTANQDGQRLDIFLSAVSGLTRAHIQKLIKENMISVNGTQKKSNYHLKIGDNIVLSVPEPEKIDVEPENIPLDILYEDEDIIVVNKARGMVVHPAPGNTHGTLVNALLSHCSDLSGINGDIRPGIVHRLDKDTSGVMVAAKNDKAHVSLAEQIRTKSAFRTYVAVVCGNITEAAGVIHGAIGRDPDDRKRMSVLLSGAAGAKDATTKFKVLERFGDYTLIECRLMTGRTHQIRVHMSYIGHPLLNDPKYGRIKSRFKIKGQALHSITLELDHPRTGERMRFKAPLPDDFIDVLNELKRNGHNV